MRALAIIAAVAGAPAPPPGIYCSISGELLPLSIGPEPGHVGVDGLDCQDAVIQGGRMRATRCYANGGSVVPYDTTLTLLPDGAIIHEREFYRRLDGRPPCP